MSASQQQPLPKRLYATAKEYLTHWFVAGVIVTVTGFTPDHWVEKLLHYLQLWGLGASMPDLDYRLLAVGAGVAIITANIVFQSWKGQAAAPAIAVSQDAGRVDNVI